VCGFSTLKASQIESRQNPFFYLILFQLVEAALKKIEQLTITKLLFVVGAGCWRFKSQNTGQPEDATGKHQVHGNCHREMTVRKDYPIQTT
jgi:hypothetical protein